MENLYLEKICASDITGCDKDNCGNNEEVSLTMIMWQEDSQAQCLSLLPAKLRMVLWCRRPDKDWPHNEKCALPLF